MIEIVPARPNHVLPIALRMQAMDQVECMVFGHGPKAALRAGLISSAIAWTAKIDGKPEAMFGVVTTSLIELSGRPWMLMTDEAAKHGRALMRFGHLYTDALLKHYDLLENLVHAHNEKSIRWLARLGYAIGGVDVINGHPMRPFIKCATRSPSP